MRLKTGTHVRLILTDGTTLVGVAEHSGQWGIHRLRDVSIFTRIDPERIKGYVLVPKQRVLFAQMAAED